MASSVLIARFALFVFLLFRLEPAAEADFLFFSQHESIFNKIINAIAA